MNNKWPLSGSSVKHLPGPYYLWVPQRIQAPSATTDLIEPTGDGSYEAMKKMEIKERFSLF